MGICPFKTNFSVIAENTTKYYMELKNSYKGRFPDDASLLVVLPSNNIYSNQTTTHNFITQS